MIFLAPWWLLGLVLVPAFLLWGLLAPRGRPVTVGSLLLWRRALAGGAAGRPTARLRLREPLLWLDASCILFLVLACARPALETARPLEPVATVVVDRTASMGAASAGSGGRRFLDARAMARRVIRAVPDAPVRRVSVPGEGGAVRADATTFGRLLEASGPDAGYRLAAGDAWRTAAAEAARHPPRPVLLVTDVARAVEVPENVFVLAPGASPASTGNAGLMRVAARMDDGRGWLLVAARASAEASGPFGVNVSTAGTVHAARSDVLTPGETAERVLAFDGPPPARLRVTLTGPADDAFLPDNEAFLVLEPGGVAVRLLGRPPKTELRRALEASGATVLTEDADGGRPHQQGADLVVACAAPLPAGWDGPAAVILPPGSVGPLRPGEGTVPAEWTVASDHPLADALYLPPPRIDRVRAYEIGDDAEVAVGTREAPLVVTWESPGARRLAVCFGLDRAITDWPRRPGFPVFWARALEWLVPAGDRRPTYRTCTPLAPVPGTGSLAPGRTGFHVVGGKAVGVSFIGTEEGFERGPGRDDSQSAIAALRGAIEARREAALAPAWPYAAALAVLALLVRAWVAR